MKKAVIKHGGLQYVVQEGQILDIDLVKDAGKSIDFKALLVADGDNVKVGQPEVEGAKVSAKVLEADVKDDKVTAIRYKAKKRVKKVRGHRQRYTRIEISKIS